MIDTSKHTFIATAAFGLEGLVKRELLRLGFADARAENGGVRFTADFAGAFTACLWLACADRVLLLMAEGEARSFEELFQLVRSAPWESVLPPDAAIPVSGRCARSRHRCWPCGAAKRRGKFPARCSASLRGFCVRRDRSVLPEASRATGSRSASGRSDCGAIRSAATAGRAFNAARRSTSCSATAWAPAPARSPTRRRQSLCCNRC